MVKAVSRIALVGENSIEYIASLLDIWKSGDCAVLMDWRIPPSTMIQMMEEAGVSSCRIDESLFKKIRFDLPSSIPFIPYRRLTEIPNLLPNCLYNDFMEDYSKNEAVIIYSSGTTGKSKGIILTHFAINKNADAIIESMNLTSEDCIYIAKTLSHSSTLTGELLVALKLKMRLVIAPTIVPPRCVLNNINKFGVTVICLNPTLLSMLSDNCKRNQYEFPTLKRIYVSGSILNDAIYNKSHTVFSPIPIYNAYGLSELGPRVTMQRTNCCKSNSVGSPIKDVNVVLVDKLGKVVANGEYGIIHVNSPSLFEGYVSGKSKHTSLYKGWHNTGDVGYIDTNGELHIINRLDDVIIIDSHKVYPSDVEKQIVEQSEVKECAVAKVELNGNKFIGCLYASEKEIDRDIKERLKSKLLVYEIPRFFLKCDALPRTKNGKVSTREVQVCLQKYISQE
jgi:long-chain acyl-CoA synthetase